MVSALASMISSGLRESGERLATLLMREERAAESASHPPGARRSPFWSDDGDTGARATNTRITD